MHRLARFLVILIGGAVGTLLVPGACLGLCWLFQHTPAVRVSEALFGLATYYFVPAGVLTSLFFAIASLRWRPLPDEDGGPAAETDPLARPS